MKVIITTAQYTIILMLLSINLAAQNFLADLEEGSKNAVPSDVFINEKGQLINSSYRLVHQIIDNEVVAFQYFDEQNRLITKRFYNHASELYYDDYGIAIYEYKYDDKGNRIEINHYDEFKELFKINFIGPAVIQFEYDEKNRVNKVRFLDTERKLTSATGFAIRTYKYNDKNQIIEESKFDEENKPLDFMAPVTRYKYDEKGRVVEKIFLKIDYTPAYRLMDAEDADDFHRMAFDYIGGEARAKFYRIDGSEIMPY
jgi:hypothetical protein